MRTIAIEEHFLPRPLLDALPASRGDPSARYRTAAGIKLLDIGTGRLADMDAAGIDVQVISAAVAAAPIESFDPAIGVPLARDCNDALADATRAHPTRLAGFALLPLQSPDAAAAELDRCVTKLGFKGALINGTINGRFLDDPIFQPVLAQAESLDVPIYLHPAPPPTSVFDAYFSGLPGDAGQVLSIAGWGWHVETGLHSLRLIVAGIFDQFPRLQIINGHMGEALPFMLARADRTLSPASPHLGRRVAEYVHDNLWMTTSGFFTVPPLLCALEVVGADRIIFAVDYPFSTNADGRAFLDTMPVSPADREKIAHRNAERLLKV